MSRFRMTSTSTGKEASVALSDEQIRELAEDGLFFSSIYEIARAIEAEVRKDDESLIRQLVERV